MHSVHCTVTHSTTRIHECGDSPGSQVLANQSFCPIPVEVWCGIADSWQVDTGCKEQGESTIVRRASASVRGASASVRGASASVRGASASVRGASASVRGASASVRGASASVRGLVQV